MAEVEGLSEVGAKLDRTAQVTNPLRTWATKTLGNAAKVSIGTGTLTAVGLEFFEKKKPNTVWASHVVPMETIVTALIARNIFSMNPAYRASIEVDGIQVELFVSAHHSRRVFSSAPAVNVGDVVNLFIVKQPQSAGGFAVAYQPLKKI